MEQTTMLKHDLAKIWDSRSIYLFGNEARQDALAHWRISFICLHNSTGYSRRVTLTEIFFFSVKYLGRSTQFPPRKRAEKCARLHWRIPSMYAYFHQTYNEFTNVRYAAAFGSSWYTLKVSQLVSSTESQINFKTYSAGMHKCETMSKWNKPLCLGIKKTHDYSYRNSTDILT
jgi:hypothetical protein